MIRDPGSEFVTKRSGLSDVAGEVCMFGALSLSSSPDPAANPSTHAASDISNGPLHTPFQTRMQRSHPFPRPTGTFKTHTANCPAAV
jgi:hypothetical protein